MRAESNYPFFRRLSITCESEISPSFRELGSSAGSRLCAARRDSHAKYRRSVGPSRTPNSMGFLVAVRRKVSDQCDGVGVGQEWMAWRADDHLPRLQVTGGRGFYSAP